MVQPIDILDERERLAAPLFWSIALHVAIVAAFVVYGLYLKNYGPRFGSPDATGGTAVTVTPVNSIPIPHRQGPENPVSNDSQSVLPSPPQLKDETKQPPPPKQAVEIPDQTRPKKFQEQTRRKQAYVQPVPKNQIPTQVPQAAVNPMYSMNQGGGGVGIGPNSPLGERFGWYAEMIRKIIARNWATNGLAGTQGAPAIIGFVIARDGRVTDVRLVQSSGNAAIDNSALRAVYNSNPLPGLPPQYSQSTAPAEFTFDLR
jgi:TonB family protein